jgi:hypothetical protein
MTYHKYVVTAQKPTATQFAVKGSFTSPYETNLVLGQVTLLYTIQSSWRTKKKSLFSIVKALVLRSIHSHQMV